MATRLLRADCSVIAMDEYNAEIKKLAEHCDYVVLFRPHSGGEYEDETFEMLERLGWTAEKMLVEGDDFQEGELPEKGKRC